MAFTINTLYCIRKMAQESPLGSVLTLGRQIHDLDAARTRMTFGIDAQQGDYVENVLKAFGAQDVSSIDYSSYENPTYIADIGKDFDLGLRFDTIIDSGTLEHVFDIASAFRNVIRHLAIGGRVAHILPVNNLNGHGFWQFSSDLLHTIYSEQNGFCDTKVYYFSDMHNGKWFEMPKATPGKRIEIVSLEPIQLIAISRKVKEVASIQANQPYYQTVWNDQELTSESKPMSILERMRLRLKNSLPKYNPARIIMRNIVLALLLGAGKSRYSVTRTGKKIDQ